MGVGPGDPELLTLKAVRILQEAEFIFVSASSKNDYSLALRVAQRHLPSEIPVARLSFPMTRNREELTRAWRENAREVVARLREFSRVVFLTLGDPLLYSTFGYLAREVRRLYPEVRLELVPGITAAQAAAARLRRVLAEGEGAFILASGMAAEEALRKFAREEVCLALYKVYRRAPNILKILQETGRLPETLAISWCGLPEEKIFEDPADLLQSTPPYFTLLLVGGKSLD